MGESVTRQPESLFSQRLVESVQSLLGELLIRIGLPKKTEPIIQIQLPAVAVTVPTQEVINEIEPIVPDEKFYIKLQELFDFFGEKAEELIFTPKSIGDTLRGQKMMSKQNRDNLILLRQIAFAIKSGWIDVTPQKTNSIISIIVNSPWSINLGQNTLLQNMLTQTLQKLYMCDTTIIQEESCPPKIKESVSGELTDTSKLMEELTSLLDQTIPDVGKNRKTKIISTILGNLDRIEALIDLFSNIKFVLLNEPKIESENDTLTLTELIIRIKNHSECKNFIGQLLNDIVFSVIQIGLDLKTERELILKPLIQNFELQSGWFKTTGNRRRGIYIHYNQQGKIFYVCIIMKKSGNAHASQDILLSF